MSDELFDQEVIGEPIAALEEGKTFLDELVGDGKKFSDTEALARGKLESDTFITRLTEEMGELRQDLKTRLTMEEFMTKLNEPATQSPNSPDDTMSGEGELPEKGFTIEDVEKLLDRRITEKEQSDLRESNLNKVMSNLESTWGPTYRKELTNKAKELGFDQDWLTNLAQENPTAFLKIVDANKPVENRLFSQPQTAVNSGASNIDTNKRARSFYVKMRQSDPEKYHSLANKSEMHRQAHELGEAFFDVDE